MVNYEKRAFAGGLMISKIDPSTNSVTIYNNNPSTTSGADNDMSLAGIEIYKMEVPHLYVASQWRY